MEGIKSLQSIEKYHETNTAECSKSHTNRAINRSMIISLFKNLSCSPKAELHRLKHSKNYSKG